VVNRGRVSDGERLRRWRLVLGGADDSGDQPQGGATEVTLGGDDRRIDAALAAVYDSRPRRRGGGRAGGLGRSSPAVVRWLGDVRRYFPAAVVQVVQRDAIERLDLRQLLFEPEMLAAIEPDVHLAGLLVELNALLPVETRATARVVVRKVVDQLQQRLAEPTRQAVHGALGRALRTRRPRPGDIDWHRTIAANLRHYLPEYGTVVPERLIGFGRRRRSVAKDVVVALDQSGSMADSVVYAAVFGAVLASMPALRTSVVAFDTAVVDLSELAADPVDLLFGVQLGGGTDIAQALAYCRGLIDRPADTVVVLISDLFEGGNSDLLRRRAAELVRAGVTMVALLALSDDGAPAYDHRVAADLAGLGVPAFACSPAMFPDVLAAALEGRDLGRWAGEHGLVTAHPAS
jgi:Mg-chelatase subunit ChlD